MATTSRSPEIGYDGKTTSWIPMSTAWPSSGGCESFMWKVVPDTLAAWDPGYGLLVDKTLKCQPPQHTTWWNADILSLGIDTEETRLSIGPIVCPEAYTTATTITNAGSSTFVACCPSSYSFVSVFGVGNTGQCVSELELDQVVKYATRNSQSSWYTATSTVDKVSMAFAIQINGWLFPEASTSSPTSLSGTTSTALTSDTSTPSPESASGLSTGAKAGIGIGVALGVMLLAAIIGALLIRRRKQKRASGQGDNQASPSEMYGSSPKDRVTFSELPGEGNRPVELP